jgi:hypothetical protein
MAQFAGFQHAIHQSQNSRGLSHQVTGSNQEKGSQSWALAKCAPARYDA